MAFENLTERLQNVFKNLRKKENYRERYPRSNQGNSSGSFRSRRCLASS
ncbi:conserved domain protein [Streptococcus infantis X]|uniref:Conserved domain protein n=1 Tax=Streptococcus infantis X TaxID=997830 RepID=F9PBB8_9STRE|nr:conserved domain protein [Streptococcus infantis X]